MAREKPSVPKGTRDFLPQQMIRRNHIFRIIRTVFERYGYQPLETPAMENLSTLTGKYGEEGDRLLFKILNSGDYWQKVVGAQGSGHGAQGSGHRAQGTEHRAQGAGHRAQGTEREALELSSNEITRMIAEKGLRYDLTVPLARMVVQHQHNLTFPFKRYQIQPVWRADRPQKGRYREFTQCDVDVLGSDALLNEVELIQIIDEVFTQLGIPVIIKVNNRKILQGIAEVIGAPEKLTDITVAIDKLEKIGLEKVKQELMQRGIPEAAIDTLEPILTLSGKIKEKKAFFLQLFGGSPTGQKGIEELCHILRYLKEVGIANKFEFDNRLARGLDYYTGTIIEVVAQNASMGSLCGGGRYDDLTGIFGLPGVSGVGISFGADRIYDVMDQLNLFPEETKTTTRVLFVNFGAGEEQQCMKLLQQVREAGINAELYPSPVKLKKQMDYANKKEIPWVVLAGQEELDRKELTIKNMQTGEQQTIPMNHLIQTINP
jgi:histidyl-tRNA synthetase